MSNLNLLTDTICFLQGVTYSDPLLCEFNAIIHIFNGDNLPLKCCFIALQINSYFSPSPIYRSETPPDCGSKKQASAAKLSPTKRKSGMFSFKSRKSSTKECSEDEERKHSGRSPTTPPPSKTKKKKKKAEVRTVKSTMVLNPKPSFVLRGKRSPRASHKDVNQPSKNITH